MLITSTKTTIKHQFSIETVLNDMRVVLFKAVPAVAFGICDERIGDPE